MSSSTADPPKKTPKKAHAPVAATNKPKATLKPALPPRQSRHRDSTFFKTVGKEYMSAAIGDFIEQAREKALVALRANLSAIFNEISEKAEKSVVDHISKMDQQLRSSTAACSEDIMQVDRYPNRYATEQQLIDALWEHYKTHEKDAEGYNMVELLGHFENPAQLDRLVDNKLSSEAKLTRCGFPATSIVSSVQNIICAATRDIGLSIDYKESCSRRPLSYVGAHALPDVFRYQKRRFIQAVLDDTYNFDFVIDC